jgi:hypothetical protein
MLFEGSVNIIVGIHQPEHLPWMGFFNKMMKCDVFVLLDNVQYEKNYFQNRNRVRSKYQWQWLTIPVITSGKSSQAINDVLIDNKSNWKKKYIDTIYINYHNSEYYNKYSDFLELYLNEWEYLVDINTKIIKYFINILNIDTKLLYASDLDISGEKSELLLDICKETGATTYLSGTSGKSYLNIKLFKKENIDVIFHNFFHPIYPQIYSPPFISHMSTLDLLYNCGDESINYLSG